MPTMTTQQERLERTAEEMRRRGVDLLFVTPSADLYYLTGINAHVSERPTIFVLSPTGPPRLLAAAFEAAGLRPPDGVLMVPYEETEDPYARLLDALDLSAPPAVAAVADRAWSAVLLGLQRILPGTQFIASSIVLRWLRMRKEKDEIELLARAGAMADEAFERLIASPFAGRTERDVADELTDLLTRAGLQRSEWGPIVGSGPNGALPHYATGHRVIESGDAVVLDFGGTLDGYQADTTRTVHVGPPPTEFTHVYEVVRQAQDTAVRAVRPGITAEAIDEAARGVIAAGYGDFFIHRTGHGLGLETHEEPYIVAGNDLRLETGMVFSVEPGIYLPGRFGVRIEDIVAVADDGVRRLNNAPRELMQVT